MMTLFHNTVGRNATVGRGAVSLTGYIADVGS